MLAYMPDWARGWVRACGEEVLSISRCRFDSWWMD